MRKGTAWTILFLLVSGCSTVSWNYENFGKGIFSSKLKSSYPERKADGFLIYKSALLAQRLGYDYFIIPTIVYDKDEKSAKALLFMRKGSSPPGNPSAAQLIEELKKLDYTLPQKAFERQGFWESFGKTLKAINDQYSN